MFILKGGVIVHSMDLFHPTRTTGKFHNCTCDSYTVYLTTYKINTSVESLMKTESSYLFK